MCASANCTCKSNRSTRGRRGIQGPPGPLSSITQVVVTELAAGATPTASISGVAPSLTLNLGIPQGTVPAITIGTVTALAPGAAPTVAIAPASTATNIILNWGIPSGAAGANGANAFGYVADPSPSALPQMPTVGNTVGLTLVPPPNSQPQWAALGQIVFVEGWGHMEMAANAIGNTLILRNTGWTGNAASGTAVNVSAKVSPAGVRGPSGPIVNGANAVILPTTTVPTAAPAAGFNTVLYYDSLATPTAIRFYMYDGAAWQAGPNMVGQAGTRIWTSAGDPNLSEPGGSVTGDYAFRQDVPSVYVRTGASAWTLVISLSPSAVATGSHTTPGTFVIGNGFQRINISANKNIELDYAAFTGERGQLIVALTNTDPSPISVTYAAAKWSRDPAATLPATLAAGATQMYHMVSAGGKMTIHQTYVNTAV
jgi:hypothetical protein